ncbi:MAG: ABC transporter ATP-binding protein [Pseudomonadota bacterium]
MGFLEIDKLYKDYGPVEVLKDINISIDEGGFLVLVGPSGCGKSTLLNTIAGLESITRGEIRIDGRTVNDLHPSKRDIAMVFQSYALYPTMSVGENIGFGMEMRGIPKDQRQKAIDEVAKMLQIEHLLKRRPGQLSGGQRQRVAMGRALVRNPKLFLFDEPLSNLDAKLRVDMRTEIKRLHQSMGTTIVYVTHDQIEAMTLATKIAVLKDGLLQQFGTPAEIYNNPANIFVADFMGSPSMNLFPATVQMGNEGPAILVDRNDGDPVRLPVGQGNGLADYAGRKTIVGIRPEAITEMGQGEQAIAMADCKVEVVEPAGADTYVVTHLGGKEVTARLNADCRLAPGQTASFAFHMNKAVFFDPETEIRIA